MRELPDPPNERARQEHYREYLEWRDRALTAQRAARRRWWLREAAIVVGLVVIGTSIIALFSFGQRDRRQAAVAPTVTSLRDGRRVPRAETAAPGESTASENATPPGEPATAREPMAPAIQRTSPRPARVAQPARAGTATAHRTSKAVRSAPPSAATESATPSASVTTPDVTAPSASEPSPPPTQVVAVTPAPSATEVVVVAPAPQTEVVAVPDPSSTEVVAVTPTVSRPECGDGRRAADCVGRWLKSQSQEFRDGVNREVGEFRNGLDTVGRGLQWLGSKLRRAE
jgi:hypothetical protein